MHLIRDVTRIKMVVGHSLARIKMVVGHFG